MKIARFSVKSVSMESPSKVFYQVSSRIMENWEKDFNYKFCRLDLSPEKRGRKEAEWKIGLFAMILQAKT